MAHTKVVSTANWHLNPPTTTSKRRLSVARTGRSKSRPHLQVCKDRGNGKRKRRKRTTRKRWRGICVKKPVGQCSASSGTCLGSYHRSVLGRQTFEEDLVSELLFDSGSSFVLPPLPKPAWLRLTDCWTGTCG